MGEPKIIGVHELPRRTMPGVGLIEVFEEAAQGAIVDAGIDTRAIDGLFLTNLPGLVPAFTLAQHLGIEPRWSDSTRIGGTAALAQVMRAATAIRAGKLRAALVVYGSLSRSERKEIGTGGVMGEIAEDRETIFGPTVSSRYAMFAQRHVHRYGTTMEQLAAPAVASRQWAKLNDTAIRTDPLTVDEVLAAPSVASPLTVPMCCVITDGGGAVLLADESVARDAKRPAIRILGAGEQLVHRDYTSDFDFSESAVRAAAATAFGESGLRPADMDLCTIYDSFTITVMTALEDAGFCPKGEAGAFVADGKLGPRGALPTNPDGGGLSTNHPGMRGIFLIIEMVRQLRREAGARQVPDTEVGAAIGLGGTLDARHASGVLVLGRD